MQSRLSTALEIITATAVVVSLVFVGMEIRNSTQQMEQNTRSLQVSAYQDLISRIVEMNAIDIDKATSIDILASKEFLDATQTQKLNSLLWILFRHGDMAYFQYESGSINQERMISAMAPLILRLQNPKIVERWKQIRNVFVPSFRAYVDDQISESSSTKKGI
ncbi:MAG: hypothetical protein P8I38_07805 [Arenicella sp.]|jgi:hypothetical protein|nr:hypothetical protein [Arenicella sp.]HAU69506.1 hypothetical protein [Gammaproteobacteria bacterium]